MKKFRNCLIYLAIIGACVCGGRTSECTDNYRMSLLTNIHDDLACSTPSIKGIMMSEAADFFINAHNIKSDMKINLSVFDTCGTIMGATKSLMKTLSMDDFGCMDPPFLLGLIGPESTENIGAVHKISSIFNIPNIVKTNGVRSPFVHHLHEESDAYIVNGIMQMIDALRWKSFTLATRKHDNNNDDVQLIAKKVTMDSITRGLCVMIHEQDDDPFTSHILYIGRPPIDQLKNINATIIIVSEGNLKNYVDQIDTHNPIILLQDARNDVAGLETQIENSNWSIELGDDIYDPEITRELRWLESAIEILAKALDILCKKTQCTSQISHAEWNTLIANVIATRNAQLEISTRTLDIYMKAHSKEFDKIGEIKIKNNIANIYWDNDENPESENNIIPESFKSLLPHTNEKTTGCATAINLPDIETNDDEDDVSKISFLDIVDDHEFWTMMGIVGGIGVTMFTIGIFAVYVVYTNIRGPRSPKQKRGRRNDRDESIRRVGSDRELQVVTGSPQRPPRPNARRDSSRSIRSFVSDKSV